MALSPDLTKEVLKPRSGYTECELITITHEEWDEPVYACTLPYEVIDIDEETGRPKMGIFSRGRAYHYVGINLILPTSQDESPPEATISFSHVGREVGTKLKMVSDSYPRVTIELVSTLNPDFVELEIPEMKLSSANWNSTEGEISLEQDISSSEGAPWRVFNIAEWPNIFVDG